MTNGRLEVSKLNDVIKKICIKKLITATPEPTSESNWNSF